MTAPALKQDVFQAISDPTRRTMLMLLANGEISISAITTHFPLSRTAINKHLYVLNDAGLVSKRKLGREMRYRLEAAPLAHIQDWLSYFDMYWDNRLVALQDIVKQD